MDLVVGNSYTVFISWGLYGTIFDTNQLFTHGDIDENNLPNG